MTNPFKSAFNILRDLLNREIKVKESLPPYLLIAALWWLSGQSDSRAREADVRQQEIQIAVAAYNSDQNNANAMKRDRSACIARVEAREVNLINWHEYFDSLKILSPRLTDYADQARAAFDSREQNKPLTVSKDCREFPEPDPVVIPPILIEEGIVDPNE